MYYGEHGVVEFVGEGGERGRERQEAPFAIGDRRVGLPASVSRHQSGHITSPLFTNDDQEEEERAGLRDACETERHRDALASYRNFKHQVPYHSAHYRGTSLIRNSPPPRDRHRALGTVLLQGPWGALFLMSEVPLYEEYF